MATETTCSREGCEEKAVRSGLSRSGMCREHLVNRNSRRDALQVPGNPATHLARQEVLLSLAAFNEGWEILHGYYKMPKDGAPKDLYYELLRFAVTDYEFAQAVRHFVREQDGYRCPSPQKIMDAVAGPRRHRVSTNGKRNSYAGCWSFVCYGCGYRKLTPSPSDEAPEYCQDCAETRYGASP